MTTDHPTPEQVSGMSLDDIWHYALPENTPDHLVGYDWARALRGEIERRGSTNDPTLPGRADALLGLRAELLGQPESEVDFHFGQAAEKLPGHDPASQEARIDVAVFQLRSMAIRQLLEPSTHGLRKVRAVADTARTVLCELYGGSQAHISETTWPWSATQLYYYYGLLELVAGERHRAWTLGRMAIDFARYSHAGNDSLELHGKHVRKQMVSCLGLMALSATELVASVPGIDSLQGAILYRLVDGPVERGANQRRNNSR